MRLNKLMAIAALTWLGIFSPPVEGATEASSASGNSSAASPLDRFSAEQRQKLLAGEPVYQLVETKAPDGTTSGHGESYIIINAPVEQCWKIFTEFDKMQEYIPRKTKSVVVSRSGNHAVVDKEFDFYLVTIKYTMLYTIDPEAHRLDFKMDQSRPHDLKDTEGYYQFVKLDDKQTLFIYAATKVDTGLKAPAFIQDYLSSRDLPAVAGNVKKRIESGGTWTKE